MLRSFLILFNLLILLNLSISKSTFGRQSTGKQIVDFYAVEQKKSVNKLLAGQTFLVTGGNSGVGLQTVKAIAYAGGRVIMCTRSIKAGYDAIENEIKKAGYGKYQVSDTSNIVVKELDLESLASIKKFAADIKRSEKSIDVLILNAGIMSLPKLIRTKDFNIERQMAVNHFGHAALTRLLLPVMKKSKRDTRIIYLSSSAHRFGNKNLMKELYSNIRYIPWISYGQSKLANMLYAKGLAKHLLDTGFGKINSFSVHPGVITSTNLFSQSVATRLFSLFPGDRNMAQSASSSVWASIAPSLDSKECRGAYIFNCKVTIPNSNGRDDRLRDEVWSVTEDILNKVGL